ncbi:MAG: BON domain-containing protein [Ginsengibacter sp.]
MKNRYRDSQYNRDRFTDNDRYRRNNNDSGDYFSSQYDRNDYNPNYNYPQSNVNNYTGYQSDYMNSGRGYNNPQPYRNNDHQFNPYKNRDSQNNDWNSRNTNYNRSNDYNDQYGERSDNYNNQERGWWDRTRDEVSSWFGDDDAERRRRMDEWRDDNHRGKGPKNYKRSPERIKEDLNDKLGDHWMLDASNIEVEVKGSEVTLNGTVSDRNDKRRAEDIADSVSGVTHVQNNLRVSKTEDVNSESTSRAFTVRNKKSEISHN